MFDCAEEAGAIRLASRMLLRVTADEVTDLGAAVAQMKSSIEPAPRGSVKVPFDPRSSEWGAIRENLIAGCDAAGEELTVESWTGG